MVRTNFNAGWTFHKAGREDQAQSVHLPHDAMIHEPRVPKLKNGPLTGEYPGGDYYYTKTLFGDPAWADSSVLVEFEGVYMDSTVRLNGEVVGGRVYGYSEFTVDLTGKLRLGQENVLEVFVHNSQVPNARWYSGSGIYRPVHLIVAGPEHIELHGVCVATKSIHPAVVSVAVQARKSGETQVVTEILRDGKLVAKASGDSVEVPVPNAALWDQESPNLYLARVTLRKGDVVLDTTEQTFGIRTLAWNSKQGLLVNGTSVKLRGGCVHHDNGVLGAATFRAAEFRRVRLLREAGFNAIRSAHNPMSRAMLDACDELGLYVMDESFDNWLMNPGTYGHTMVFADEWEKDTRAMVLADRNHPSVVMYSIGNEIPDTAFESGIELARQMKAVIAELDPHRPVTVCINLMINVMYKKGMKLRITGDKPMKKDDVVNPLEEAADTKMGGSMLINFLVAFAPFVKKLLLTPKSTGQATEGTFGHMDIAGYNYGEPVYVKHHDMYPDRVIVGSESEATHLPEIWHLVKEHPHVIGDFQWTGWEYLGEAGAGVIDYGASTGTYTKPYPVVSSGCGAIDLIGVRDTNAYLSAAVWGLLDKPYLGVEPVNHSGEKRFTSMYRRSSAVDSWSWKDCDGKKAEILVIADGTTVELKQDGRSLGTKKLKDFQARFAAIHRPGSLEAITFDRQGKELGRTMLKTAGQETFLNVTPETTTLKADGEDLAYVNVLLTDQSGIVKTLEDRQVRVSVTGNGSLQGIGSGTHRPTEPYTGDSFTTYNGRLVAVVRAGARSGSIEVEVSAAGLTPRRVTLQVHATS